VSQREVHRDPESPQSSIECRCKMVAKERGNVEMPEEIRNSRIINV
jgi:hypothetical protein